MHGHCGPGRRMSCPGSDVTEQLTQVSCGSKRAGVKVVLSEKNSSVPCFSFLLYFAVYNVRTVKQSSLGTQGCEAVTWPDSENEASFGLFVFSFECKEVWDNYFDNNPTKL